MTIRKHALALGLALGLALALGAGGTGVALAQGMPDAQPGQGSGMMGGMMGGGQGGMGPGMMMDGGMMPCPLMAEGMGMMQRLDPDQRSEMRELMQEHRPAQFERMGRLMNLRDDLMAEMHAERPDPEEVQALHGRMAELHGEMMAEMVRMRNAMHDLMTDEQREQLRQAAPADMDPEDHDAHH
jgi:periplasmic protein CpxP/Spy